MEDMVGVEHEGWSGKNSEHPKTIDYMVIVRLP